MPFFFPRQVALASSALSISSVALLLRGNTGPRRDFGGISHFDIDPGLLDQNVWQGQSKVNEFRVVDDLEPIAPMDRLTQDVSPEVPGYEDLSAPVQTSGRFDPLFVPSYQLPDAFPAAPGSPCMCGPKDKDAVKVLLPGHASSLNDLTFEELEALYRAYGKENVNNLVKKATAKAAHHSCKCGEDNGPYRFVKAIPVFNSSDYVLKAADATYSAGNYWEPKPEGGIVAPADRLPRGRYPLQAEADGSRVIPAAAIEDRIDHRFAKYIDQVEARSSACDSVSEECTIPCGKGDNVTLELGSTRVNAAVLSAHIGNALLVEIVPAAAKLHSSWTKTTCGVEAGCTVFRPCYANNGAGCVEEEDLPTKDFAGNLQTNLQCPQGTTLCATVREVVSATFARKGSRSCKAAHTPTSA